MSSISATLLVLSTHTLANTHTYKRMHTHTHTHTHTHNIHSACPPVTCSLSHTHPTLIISPLLYHTHHTHTHTRRVACTHICMNKHTRTHTHTHTERQRERAVYFSHTFAFYTFLSHLMPLTDALANDKLSCFIKEKE